MPIPQPLIRLLPALIRIAPELVTGTVTRGKIIALADVKPESETDLARKLDRKTKAKKRRKYNDAVHVVKVADAIKCIEDQFNNTSLLVQFLLGAAKAALGDEEARTAAQGLADKMAECIRDKSLTQKNPRVLGTSRYYQRPAKGHGRGRT